MEHVSRTEFRRALNLRCHKELGVGLNDLPDIINLDDVWWEYMTEREAGLMIDGCIKDFQDELCPNQCDENHCFCNQFDEDGEIICSMNQVALSH